MHMAASSKRSEENEEESATVFLTSAWSRTPITRVAQSQTNLCNRRPFQLNWLVRACDMCQWCARINTHNIIY